MPEINLLENYRKSKRNLQERRSLRSPEIQTIARKFGQEFFDGDRIYGYGGYSYHQRFWQPVIPTFQAHYGLTAKSSVLDVGCAKGFMIHDMAQLIHGITVKGVDISEYAIANAIEGQKANVMVANATSLPFPARIRMSSKTRSRPAGWETNP